MIPFCRFVFRDAQKRVWMMDNTRKMATGIILVALISLAGALNAAPFAQMVADNIPCVYTAGYPGLAVKVFLHKLGEAGVVCVHEGDADLDGFRIAKEVSNAIKVVRVVASEALAQSRPEDGIEMDADQRRRAWAFAANCPDFKYSDEVKSLSVRGYWIEQESFKSILGKGGRRK